MEGKPVRKGTEDLSSGLPKCAEEFEKIQEDLKAEDSVKKETARALEQFISLPEQKIAPGETDRILEDLTREYHRSTGS